MAHGDAKNACEIFISGRGVKGLTILPIDQDLIDVASAFHDLQQVRHDADYDLMETFDRVQVLGHVQRVKEAMAKWKLVRNSPNADVFLAALFLHSKWNK
jgi:hypothetical protein